MTSIWVQLKVIIWKNVTIRKHHFILTTLEILFPVAVFYFVALSISYSQNIFDYKYIGSSSYVPVHSSRNIYKQFNPNMFMCYAPLTKFTSQIIKRVELKLRLNNETIKPFNNELNLLAYYNLHGYYNPMIAIVFKNIPENRRVVHLDYAIMIGETNIDWHLPDLFDDSQGSYKAELGSENYFRTGFLALQMAIDTAYIEMLQTEILPVKLTMQEFPYPLHYDEFMATFIYFLFTYVTIFSFMLICPAVLKRILEERSTGTQELMKLMGLRSWMLWLGWFLYAFTVNLITVTIITVIITMHVWSAEYAIINFCNGRVFFVFLLSYCTAAILFCFAIGVFFYKPTPAIITSILIWQLAFFVPLIITETYPYLKWPVKIFFMLSPNMAVYYGFEIIGLFERRKIPLNLTNFNAPIDLRTDAVTMANVITMLLIDVVVYALITFYVDNIYPGPYGVGKPFYFPITYIWKGFKKKNKVENEESTTQFNDNIEPNSGVRPCIKLRNVCEKFGRLTALNNLSMNIYEEEITVLLGHTNSGKTSLLCTIAGLHTANTGKVLINNMDIRYNKRKIPLLLGFCPQHNLLFRDLTVKEHLTFFGMLKGYSLKMAKSETEILLRKMKMYVKSEKMASNLSDSMKRKLSLATAVIGYPKILILDEPTSGLDPDARREIWDMLLLMKNYHTIVISTHLMEEADVLSDRIAIIDHGQLQCYGTPMFLRTQYGAGYHLVLTREVNANPDQIEEIAEFVQTTIYKASLHSINGNKLIFLLPYEMKFLFGKLLEELESKKIYLGIENIGMSITTMEEIFLKVGKNAADVEFDDITIESASTVVIPTALISNFNRRTNVLHRAKGIKLLKLQIWSLFKKRWHFAQTKWPSFFILVILLMSIVVKILYNTNPPQKPISASKNKIDFALSKYGRTSVFFGGKGFDRFLINVEEIYQKLIKTQNSKAAKVTSVSDAILSKGEEHIGYYFLHMIIAAEFNVSNKAEITLNAMYSNRAFHGAPISLNLVTNALLKGIADDRYSISTSNSPLASIDFYLGEGRATAEWTILFPLGMLFLATIFFLYPHAERKSGIKQLQFMCGVQPATYWLICYVFDLMLYIISIAALILLITGYEIFKDTMYFSEHQCGPLIVIFMAFGLSILPFAYVFTYKRSLSGAYMIFLIIGLVLTLLVLYIEKLIEHLSVNVSKYQIQISILKNIEYILCILPPFGLSYNLMQFSKKSMANYIYDQNSPEDKAYICKYVSSACCDGETTLECINYKSYFGTHKYSITYHVIIMALSAVIYFVSLLLLDSNFLHKYYEIFKTKSLKKINKDEEVQEVETETDEILETLNLEKKRDRERSNVESTTEDDVLLVYKLEKSYKSRKIVKGISFVVKSGDCLGLLGINGCGKTTIFQILTGYLPLINGEARILISKNKRVYLSTQRNKFLKNVGYCPEFHAMNEVLTGRQMLTAFAQLRGMSYGIEDEVDKYLTALGLEEYAETQCGLYSPCNKRKLNVAMAFIGNPLLVMLDQPTLGMDPTSRREMWDFLDKVKYSEFKSSIILTSYSMEECEFLCNRLAIIKAGRLECCGTISDLKNKYGRGFTIFLKIKPIIIQATRRMHESTLTLSSSRSKLVVNRSASIVIRERDTSIRTSPTLAHILTEDPPTVLELMFAFEQKYKGCCTLQDKHVGLLHYHINDETKKWSLLFSEIEALKLQYPIIDDYSISETTLEEVFLSIARTEAHK